MYTVNRLEIESLMSIFKQQTKAKLDRPKFRDVLHNQFDMTDDLIMDRGYCSNKSLFIKKYNGIFIVINTPCA